MKHWITRLTASLGSILFIFISPTQAQNESSKSAGTGNIEIISSPDQAMVHIDGKKLGLTP